MELRGLLVDVVRAALVGDGQVLLVFREEIAGSDLHLEGEAAAHRKHVAVAQADETALTLVAAAAVLKVIPGTAGEEAEVVAVPGTAGREPPAGLGVDGRYLVISGRHWRWRRRTSCG